jgi:hypothetical protein
MSSIASRFNRLRLFKGFKGGGAKNGEGERKRGGDLSERKRLTRWILRFKWFISFADQEVQLLRGSIAFGCSRTRERKKARERGREGAKKGEGARE